MIGGGKEKEIEVFEGSSDSKTYLERSLASRNACSF